MSRVQLALNVSNLGEAIDFYSKFFKSEPTKVRPGYANFAIEEPPLKLVLIESEGEPGSINHLGVEVFSTSEVVASAKYFSEVGLTPRVEENTTCCFALQDKVWVDGVDGSPWEVYTVHADSLMEVDGGNSCCMSDQFGRAACC